MARNTLEHRYGETSEAQSVHAMSNREIIESFRYQEGRETLEMKVSQNDWDNPEKRAIAFQQSLAAGFSKQVSDINNRSDPRDFEAKYRAQVGENWRDAGRETVNASRSLHDTGNALAYEGIRTGNEAKLEAGRALMEGGVTIYQEFLDRPQLAGHLRRLVHQGKWPGMDHTQGNMGPDAAQEDYLRVMQAGINDRAFDNPEARQLALEAVQSQHMTKYGENQSQAAREELDHHMTQIGNELTNHPQGELRRMHYNLNQVGRRMLDHQHDESPTSQIERGLVHGSDAHSFRIQREHVQESQQAIAGTIFALKEGENLGWNVRQETEYVVARAEQQNTEADLRKFLDGLESRLDFERMKTHADMNGYDSARHECGIQVLNHLRDIRESLDDREWDGGMTDREKNLLRNAAMMEQVTHPGRMEQAVGSTAGNEKWRGMMEG